MIPPEVLARYAEPHRRYAQLIRQEYAHVPDAAYHTGRAAVLARFLQRPRLYFGEHPDRERQARVNMAAELQALTGTEPSAPQSA